MNLKRFLGSGDGPYCCVCGNRISKDEALKDVSGWLCPDCGDGVASYLAAKCTCLECGVTFERAWQQPMNAKKPVIPNRLTCPKCGLRAADVVAPTEYTANMPVEGDGAGHD